jgi:predicted DNA-binding transcriptional regulator AlpA
VQQTLLMGGRDSVMRAKLQDTFGYAPRGMDADHAAAYCGLSRTKFLELVSFGTLPQSKDLGGVPRWDRKTLDAAWDALETHNKRFGARRKALDELLEAEDGEGEPAIRQ